MMAGFEPLNMPHGDDALEAVLMADEKARDRKSKAIDNIMTRGNVLKFLVRLAQKNHVGDTDIIKHLLASIACTNSLTIAGIQPELNGPKGHGKTDAVRSVFHLIPDKWKLSASISAKALYYHQGLLAGSIIFSDDVQWSEDLISTVKRSMGSFQEPQTHFTLDANRNPLPHTMPERLGWWLSSVESVANDQLKDRQYSLDIDDGTNHAEKVSDFLRISRAKKRVRFSVDSGTEIAREIIARIKEHEPFKVVIDCAEKADWKVKDDHRTQNKFWDLVEALAILRFEQRPIDEDGWLHATKADFEEARTIFMRRNENHQTHLTNSQTNLVKAVIALSKTGGATQAKIAEHLGISISAVSKGLKTIEANTKFIVHSPGPYGEQFYKSVGPSFESLYRGGVIVSLPDDYTDPFNPIQPPFNHDSTIHSTNKNDNNNNNQSPIQPNTGECNKDGLNGDLVESQPYHSRKTGLKVEWNGTNPAIDSDSTKLKEVENQVECEVESTILRFLKPVPAFLGEDLRTYGPFKFDDVATVPKLNSKGLIERDIAVEVHPGIGPHLRGDEPTLTRKEPDASEKIRIASIAEYGVNGWVDPRKVAAKLHIDLAEVEAWLQAQSNYVRTQSGNGYTQRSKAEAA
jgi:hypothetical protein